MVIKVFIKTFKTFKTRNQVEGKNINFLFQYLEKCHSRGKRLGKKHSSIKNKTDRLLDLKHPQGKSYKGINIEQLIECNIDQNEEKDLIELNAIPFETHLKATQLLIFLDFAEEGCDDEEKLKKFMKDHEVLDNLLEHKKKIYHQINQNLPDVDFKSMGESLNILCKTFLPNGDDWCISESDIESFEKDHKLCMELNQKKKGI